MKLPHIIFLALFIFNVSLIRSQACFIACAQRLNRSVDTLRTTEQIEQKIHEADPLSANKKILTELIGCEFPKIKLSGLSGKWVSINDLKGKPVVVSFWFSSCATCIAEISSLNKLAREYENTAYFLSVNTDDLETLKEFVKGTPYHALHVCIPREMGYKEFCTIGGFPCNMILDKEGKVTDVWAGDPDPNKKDEFYNRIKKGLDSMK
jgi:peroxiredoxin